MVHAITAGCWRFGTVLAVLACFVCPLVALPYLRARGNVALIEFRHGVAFYYPDSGSPAIQSLLAPSEPAGLIVRNLSSIELPGLFSAVKTMQSIDHIWLEECVLDDEADLTQVRLPSVRELSIEYSSVCNHALSPSIYAAFPNLETIHFVNSGTDDDIQHLAKTSGLVRLVITQGTATGMSLGALAACRQLEEVSLYRCPVSGSGITEGIRLACNGRVFLTVESSVESPEVRQDALTCSGALCIETPSWYLVLFEDVLQRGTK